MLKDLRVAFIMWMGRRLGYLAGLDAEGLLNVRYRLRYGIPRPGSVDYILLEESCREVQTNAEMAARVAEQKGVSIDSIRIKAKQMGERLAKAPQPKWSVTQ